VAASSKFLAVGFRPGLKRFIAYPFIGRDLFHLHLYQVGSGEAWESAAIGRRLGHVEIDGASATATVIVANGSPFTMILISSSVTK
jgi:hypothetical protein